MIFGWDKKRKSGKWWNDKGEENKIFNYLVKSEKRKKNGKIN